jgi:hypothetical protein
VLIPRHAVFNIKHVSGSRTSGLRILFRDCSQAI